ncbi:DNA ligase [archaeon]|nr:DNA ligase [archaeon]|tara:strand:+ start:3360 stop:5033 length:1674 start_codon:yes stop_codon:yes gene_type:complete
MLYSELVKVYQELEKTTKRLEKTDIIADFIKKISKENLSKIIYLLEGRIFPEWDDRKIGFSTRLMIKALATCSGRTSDDVEKLFTKKGDLGDAALELLDKKTQRTLTSKNITVDKVVLNIHKLADLEGEGTVNKKLSYVTELLVHANKEEARYIVKTILEELRVGTASGVMRDSISKAFDRDVKDVEKSSDLLADFGEVALLAKENKLNKVSLKPGRPLKLMLALLSKNIQESFESLGKKVQIEEKIDGFRVEVHKYGDNIRLFTRNLEEVTNQFPDVVSIIKEKVKGENFILDCEVVGIDKKTRKHTPFQSISQRIRRKHDIEKMAKDFPVEISVFDLIFYNDKSLMDKNLMERRKLLEKIVKESKRKIVLTKKLVTNSIEKAEKFYDESLKKGMEGVMVKNLDSKYRPGRYVNGWVKLKNILDPLDLVIVKAEFGEGKRTKWLSSYTVACKNGDEYLELGKVSTGVKEKTEGLTYNEMTKLLKPLIKKQKGKEVIVKPKIIIEVGYEEIQKSTNYNSGFALRFPRVHFLRMDKPLSEVNDLNTVEKIYKIQRGER